MRTDIIIMGAKGRMGATLVQLVQQDATLDLVGVCERKSHITGLQQFDCRVEESLTSLLPQFPQAVIVDFTAPDASVETVQTAAESGNPVVIGTTGLSTTQQGILTQCAKSTPVFWAPNMSIGINVLLKVLPQLVQALGFEYDVEISEIHHKMKKDAPSGTALKLGQCLAESRGWKYDEVKCHSRDGMIGERPQQELGVQTLRGGDVVGDHTVHLFGPGERIEVTHRAHSRETFAAGALRAAKWLKQQKSGKLYSMADLF